MDRPIPQGPSWALAFKPFRDMFVFPGRSTRSEVVSFWLLGLVAGAIKISMNWGHPVINGAFDTFFWLLWSFPWIALFVRRLHDQGRPGWWALLMAAPFAILLALASPATSALTHWSSPVDWTFEIIWSPLTGILVAVYVAAILAELVLFLLPGTAGANRFGPDPRMESGRAAAPQPST